jgi:hypothetical protein
MYFVAAQVIIQLSDGEPHLCVEMDLGPKIHLTFDSRWVMYIHVFVPV